MPETTRSGMERINKLEMGVARLDERTNAMKAWMEKIENAVLHLDRKLDEKLDAVSGEISKVKVQNAATNAIIGIIIIVVIKFWT